MGKSIQVWSKVPKGNPESLTVRLIWGMQKKPLWRADACEVIRTASAKAIKRWFNNCKIFNSSFILIVLIYRDGNWRDMVTIIIKQLLTVWNHFPLEFAVRQMNLTLTLGMKWTGSLLFGLCPQPWALWPHKFQSLTAYSFLCVFFFFLEECFLVSQICQYFPSFHSSAFSNPKFLFPVSPLLRSIYSYVP